MALNPFFLQGSPGEQRLIQDLVNEQLKMYGEDVLYLPRKIIGENTVIRENTAAKFDDSFRIEAYLMNYEGFAGASAELLTKFGVRNTDELTLVISKERYDDFVQPIIDQFPAGERKKAKMDTGFALIIDDCQGDLNPHGKKGGAALRLCTRHRHEVSPGDPALFIISNQKWNGMATVLRANATGVILFGNIKSKKELDVIREDLADSIGGGQKFDEMFARAAAIPYAFLYIRLDSTPPEVYLNFQERLF